MSFFRIPFGYRLAPLAPSASVLDTDEIIALGSDDPTTAAALSALQKTRHS